MGMAYLDMICNGCGTNIPARRYMPGGDGRSDHRGLVECDDCHDASLEWVLWLTELTGWWFA